MSLESWHAVETPGGNKVTQLFNKRQGNAHIQVLDLSIDAGSSLAYDETELAQFRRAVVVVDDDEDDDAADRFN